MLAPSHASSPTTAVFQARGMLRVSSVAPLAWQTPSKCSALLPLQRQDNRFCSQRACLQTRASMHDADSERATAKAQLLQAITRANGATTSRTADVAAVAMLAAALCRCDA